MKRKHLRVSQNSFLINIFIFKLEVRDVERKGAGVCLFQRFLYFRDPEGS